MMQDKHYWILITVLCLAVFGWAEEEENKCVCAGFDKKSDLLSEPIENLIYSLPDDVSCGDEGISGCEKKCKDKIDAIPKQMQDIQGPQIICDNLKLIKRPYVDNLFVELRTKNCNGPWNKAGRELGPICCHGGNVKSC